MIIKQILKGWSNVVLDALNMLDDETKEMATNRLSVCSTCPLKNDNEWCDDKLEVDGVSGCGCMLSAAATLIEKECPRDIWPK